MHHGDAAVIAGKKPDQHVREVIAGGAVEPPHDAEIDNRKRALGINEHVSGMQIGMEETVPKDLVEEGCRCVVQQVGDRMPGRDQPVAVIDPNAGNALGRQHRAPGAPPIDLRHAKGRVAGEISRQFRCRGGLEPQIHFELHRLGEGHHHLDRLQPAQRRRRALDQLREPQKQFEVAREGAGDAGSQYLDRDRAAVGRDREMNLRDRRRGGRHIVE